MLVKAIPSYISTNHYADWAEIFPSTTWKTEDDFMTPKSRKPDFDTVDALGVFTLHALGLDTKEDYNRYLQIWDRNLTA